MGLTVNDFFCGAGGMGLGFKQAGFTIVGSYDFDKYAVQSYAANVESHVQQADIKEMTGQDLNAAHGWLFGFPCQDLSVAGHGAGLFEGKRSGLFFEVMRLLDEVIEHEPSKRPVFLLAENVKGLKPYLPVLHDEYERRGYVMFHTLYNSKYWGVPQSRERYFVVGIRKNVIPQMGYFQFASQQTAYIPRLREVLEPCVDDKYYLPDEKAEKIIELAMQRLQGKGQSFTIDHGTCIDTRQHKDGNRLYDNMAPTLSGTCHKEPKLVVEDATGCSLRTRTYAGQPQQLEIRMDEISNTITTVPKDAMVLERLQAIYTDKDECAYACNARYYKGASYADIGKSRNTQIIEPQIECVNPRKDDGTQTYQQDRTYTADGIVPAVTAQLNGRTQIVDEPQIEFWDMGHYQNDHMNRVYDPDGLSPTLTTVTGGGRHVKIVTGVYGEQDGFIPKDVSGTLDAHAYKGLRSNQQRPAVAEISPRFRVRRLTPREYFRLQGFPDDYKFVCSDTQLYKQAGNAVTVNVAKGIADQLAAYLVRA